MFGRAYRGGTTKDLALRMKAGQQLVFGEQLGWIDPGLVNEHENAEFFRQACALRARFNRYFRAGTMGRPPRLLGEVPPVRADWQWSGQWWVTTDAVLTGAWQLAQEKRAVLLFANVSDAPVTAKLRIDPRAYGLPAGQLHLTSVAAGEDHPGEEVARSPFERSMIFPASSVQALELH